MSLWGVHIGVAVIVTTLVLFVVARGARYRGGVVVASGVWAVLPDAHHVLDAFPALQATWRAFHRSATADVFWLHYTIDRLDPGDDLGLSLAMWGALAVVVAGTELAIRRERG